jgi:amyloid beta precursor protein binding protein 1
LGTLFSCVLVWFLFDFASLLVFNMSPSFVVDQSSLGQSKAKCVCSFLQELNDAVKAKFVEEYPDALIETNPSFFSQFTLVVATQVR